MVNENNEKKEIESINSQEKPKMREIIILTDGTNIQLAKAEVAGNIELIGILKTILQKIDKTE